MAQPAQPRPAERPLAPVPTGRDEPAERGLVETLDRISRHGGSVQFSPPPRPYGFPGGRHVNLSQELHLNLWRFGLSAMARDLLDHMTVTHDDHGTVGVTQDSLARYFGCSQTRIQRALAQLSRHHLVWKVRNGRYQLNPTYAYRFSSRKHALLLARLGSATLTRHKIVIPLPEKRS
ncbi:hypothetical protein [Streptomyces sp. NPDC051561]|uniref:hypothetical protein n=1 Tax=Streptomyces sp. NPDC051561 TaxID=3365658 RepID=UPI00379BAA29